MKTYALMAANIILWGFFTWSGFNGIRGLQARHVPGYPNRGQIEFYIVFPLLMVAIAVVLPILLRRTRWSGRATTILMATLLLLIPYGLTFTGGM
jgi:hypothetical protein